MFSPSAQLQAVLREAVSLGILDCLNQNEWFRIVFQLSGRRFWRTDYFYDVFTPIITVFFQRCQKAVPNFTDPRKAFAKASTSFQSNYIT